MPGQFYRWLDGDSQGYDVTSEFQRIPLDPPLGKGETDGKEQIHLPPFSQAPPYNWALQCHDVEKGP